MIILMENKKKLPVKMGLIVLGLAITGYLSVFMVPRMLVTMSKAAPATKVSISSSYVLGEKMLAKADGDDKCVVNVFVLDSSGKGVIGKSVVLEGIKDIKPDVSKTNSDGKVTFKLGSTTEGQFPITAMVEGVALPRTVTVTFRNSI